MKIIAIRMAFAFLLAIGIPFASVSLVSPPDGNWANQTSSQLQFGYNYADAGFGAANCTLIIDGIAMGGNSTGGPITPNSSIADGPHSWNVNCSNGSGSEAAPSDFTLTLGGAPPATSAPQDGASGNAAPLLTPNRMLLCGGVAALCGGFALILLAIAAYMFLKKRK